MLFQILGGVGVEADGIWNPVTAARQQAAFCLLALSANRVVSRAALVDAIWGDQIPQHPDAALHIVVSRLRAALGPAASRLVSVSSGYRLDVASDELDYTVVQSEFVRGRSLLRDNDAARAADVLAGALEHWPSEALKGLADFPFYEQAKTQLDEMRATIEETRYEAMLAAGRHIEVLALISPAIAADPWREQLRRHRMIALYRSGRQVDALREYDEYRDLLVEEVGVEPSGELAELRMHILDQDKSLLLARAGVAQLVPGWTATSLPWVGRSEEEELIFDRLRAVSNGGQRMVVIEGQPGIGKTRLLMEVARRVSDDVILVAATANDVTRPAVVALAEGLADASSALTDAELRLCLGRWAGEIAAVVPRVARRLGEDVTPLPGDTPERADRLRDGVSAWIMAISHRAPVLLLLDNLERAGPGLLLFLTRLFERDNSQRVLVLATSRSRGPDHAAKLETLLHQLDEHGWLDRLELEGLRGDELEVLLSQLGMPDAVNHARSLHEATGGHPFFVSEMLQGDNWDVAVPSTVREFVQQRVRALGIAEEQSLIRASCFVTGFDLPLLESVADITGLLAIMHVNRALEAGILRHVDAHSFTFAHDLTRRSLYELLSSDDAARIHRRIALALEGRREPSAVLATHWRLATGEDARAKTYFYAAAAADEAARALDPDSAVSWFDVALEHTSTATDRATALIGLADAQRQAGDPRCVETLRDAVRGARELQDAELLVSCALAWTPIWESMPPLESDERIALLEDALALATTEQDRSRLLARLASEFLYTEQRERARILADDALAAARRAGDVPPPEVAMRYFHATWSPHSLSTRRALMAETLGALAPNDIVNRCFALSMSAAGALEAADHEQAETEIDEMLELADAHEIAVLTLNATTTRCWRAALGGELDEAGRLAFEALTLAPHDRMARNGIALQLAYIAWQQGRFAELKPFIDQLDADVAGPVTKRVMVARVFAALDQPDAAGNALESISRKELQALPQDMLWSSTVILAAEAAFMVGCKTWGGWTRELLEPFRELVAVANFVLAPIAYGAGVAAAAAGDDDFDDFFREALDVSRRLNAPVLQARTEIAWTVAQRAFGTAGPTLAIADDARAICQERNLTHLGTSADTTTWRLR